MSGTTSGIAAGYGGFAMTPQGEAQYLAYRNNPFKFLLQPQDVTRDLDPRAATPGQGGLAGYASGGSISAPPAADPLQAILRAAGLSLYPDPVSSYSSQSGEAASAPSNPSVSKGADYNATMSPGRGGSGGIMSYIGKALSVPFASQIAMLGNAFNGAAAGAQQDALMSQVTGTPADFFGAALSGATGLGLGSLGDGARVGGLGGLGNMGGAGNYGAMHTTAPTMMDYNSAIMGPQGGLASPAAIGRAEAIAHSENMLDPGADGLARAIASDAVNANAASYNNQGAVIGGPTSGGFGQGNGGQGGDPGEEGGPASGGLYAAGGLVQGAIREPNDDFFLRRLARGSGLVGSLTPGRADAVHAHVPKGAYVVPADVVSGLGQGNTMAGGTALGRMIRGSVGKLPAATTFARGGEVGGTIPVKLSGGEYVIHPKHVAALGGPQALDRMVAAVRAQSARAASALPPPR